MRQRALPGFPQVDEAMWIDMLGMLATEDIKA